VYLSSGMKEGYQFGFVLVQSRCDMCGEEPSIAFVRSRRLVRLVHPATDGHIKHPYENTMAHKDNRGPTYRMPLYEPITVTCHPGCDPVPGWT
jgi:hypothetical protein